MVTLYDQIGRSYDTYRRADPRIERLIFEALAGASSVVNVGAGSGSYELSDRFVVALEVSMPMISQRLPNAAPVVQGSAGSLPFRDKTFDAALAILTVHHWPNPNKGLQELTRVARGRIVILTWDPEAPGFWLVNDYFPEILRIDRTIFPSMDDFRHELGKISIINVPIPHDCLDGFLGAYWRRPNAYLDSKVRSAISTFSKIKNPAPGIERLRLDLDTGEWVRRYGDLLVKSSLDLGYRLVIAA